MPSTSFYGNTTGTGEGPGTGSQTTVVTKIVGYDNSDNVLGIRLYWGTSNNMWGSTGGASAKTFDVTGDPVYKIEYSASGGNVRGVKFTNSTSSLALGNMSGPTTAINNVNYEFTDMETNKGDVNGIIVLWGMKFYYNDNSFFRRICPTPPENLAWPALSLMAHAAVVAKSLKKVGKLRGTLAIKAPSCDPPLTTSPSDSQLWYRTFRAQENCKEMFLVYLPSILVASTMGYQAFGSWVPTTVGTLSFLGAYFRYKYLCAYIEDADKRGKPFYYATLCMKPIFFIAVVSSGYVVGKQVYKFLKGSPRRAISSSEEDDE